MSKYIRSDPAPQFFPETGTQSTDDFIFLFEIWANQRNLDDKGKKLALLQCLPSAMGQAWWKSKRDFFTDDTITWDVVKTSFKNSMSSTNKEDKIKFWDICSNKQKSEPASQFIQTMKYQATKSLPTIDDRSLADLIIHNMESNIKKYIITRGKPTTYANLEKMVQEYEHANIKEEMDIKTENPVLIAQLQRSEKSSCEINEQLKNLTKGIDDLLKTQEGMFKHVLMTKLKNDNDTSDSDDDENYWNSKNIPKCYGCGKPGHIVANCWSIQNGQGQFYHENPYYASHMPFLPQGNTPVMQTQLQQAQNNSNQMQFPSGN